jgi:D-xylose transport system ATP-binding protein
MDRDMDDKKRAVVLKVEGVTKSFGSVVALNGVSFEVYEDETVGIVGDNGAGKSTLIKIISGNFHADSGSVYFCGRKTHFKNPSDARRLGIETVYQDLSICDNLDSVSNIFIGRELYRNVLGFGVLNKKKMEKKTVEVLDRVGIRIPSVHERVEYLSGGQRQAVALGRFVAWGKRLILLDEPTAALGVRETRIVLDLIKGTGGKNVSIILITHNLQQMFEIVDRIVVLRHGEVVGIRERRATDPGEIVSLITGAVFINKSEK